MFCKYCGKSISGTKCEACGKENTLLFRSREIDNLKSAGHSAKQTLVQTYQQGLKEGYENGKREENKQGYSKQAADATPKRNYRVLMACLCITCLVIGCAVGGMVGHNAGQKKGILLGEQQGLSEGKEAGYAEGQMLADQKLQDKYYEGYAAGKQDVLASLPTLTPTTMPTPVPTGNASLYKKGMKREEIVEIQQRLIELGYLVNDGADGDYGDMTFAAVNEFQQQHHLPVNGEIDKATYDTLMSDDAIAKERPTATSDTFPKQMSTDDPSEPTMVDDELQDAA